MEASTSFSPDPGYQNLGHIDVLLPPPTMSDRKLFQSSDSRDVATSDEPDKISAETSAVNSNPQKLIDSSSKSSSTVIGACGEQKAAMDAVHQRHDKCGFTLRRPTSTTPGYLIDQYDMERRVVVGVEQSHRFHQEAGKLDGQSKVEPHSSKADLFQGTHSTDRKRKRDIEENCADIWGSSTYHRHKACWDAFEPYLERCVPVKLSDVTLFRHISDKNINDPGSEIKSNSDKVNPHDFSRAYHGEMIENPDFEINSKSHEDGEKFETMSGIFGRTKLRVASSVLPTVDSFLSEILDTIVTVQCAFPPSGSNKSMNQGTFVDMNAQSIDEAISFSTSPSCECKKHPGDESISNESDVNIRKIYEKCNCLRNAIPIFMGQEDQVTTNMTLREAIHWRQHGMKNLDQCNDSIEAMNNGADSAVSPSPSMAVCVAQEPIVTLPSWADQSEVHYKSDETRQSAGEERIKQHQIMVDLEGRVSYWPSDFHQEDSLSRSLCLTSDDDRGTPPMSPLARMLCLPSYLLLGDPKTGTLGNECNGFISGNNNRIEVHNVNFWHAPQHCRTNVHYDERDNLLLVTEGVKTVELCPPGCILGSGVYSEHANHPAVLRRFGTGYGACVESKKEGDTDSEKCSSHEYERRNRILKEVKRTTSLKKGRTHVISVSAGEGLYIPRGWWHRVESAPSGNPVGATQSTSCRGCTAVNIWFEYSRTKEDVPKHMVPFQIRKSARRHYETNVGCAAQSLLKEKRQQFFPGSRFRYDFLHPPSLVPVNEWELMTSVLDHAGAWNMDCIERFGKAFVSCWNKFTTNSIEEDFCKEAVLPQDSLGMSTKPNQKIILEKNISPFRQLLEVFLLLTHISGLARYLVRFWTLFFLPSASDETKRTSKEGFRLTKTELFQILIGGISRESCYIITQGWENDERTTTSSTDGIAHVDVEASYRSFFTLVGEENEESTRIFLLENVEMFQQTICQSFLLDGLLLGNF